VLIGPRAFGHHLNRLATTPFPAIGAGSYRVWDNGLTWRLLEPTDGGFTATAMRQAIDGARAAGMDIVYEAGQPPAWATGGVIGGSLGIAYNNLPPTNLSDWVAYLTWVDDNFACDAYGVWNEPSYGAMWGGTVEQLRALHVAMYDLLKPRGRTILTASVADGGVPIGSGANYLLEYLTPEIVAKTDVVSYHNYVYPLPPEQIIVSLRHVKAVLRRAGAGHLPLWNTEYGWFGDGDFADAKAAAYVARAMPANIIGGADRSHFYGVDFDNAQITLVETGTPSVLTPAGIAHRTVANLLTGAQLYRFRQRPPLYTVDWTKAGGRGRIFWCDDDETQTVDLSGYSSGTDVLGDPITLSAAYEVGMSPVFCAR
jgi:hypothetical protein